MLLAALLAFALAQQHGGGGAHPPPPPIHIAPPRAPQAGHIPPPIPQRPPGFNLPHDVPPPRPPQAGHVPPPIPRPVQPLPHYQPRPPARGPRIPPPHPWTHPWGWNNGIAWNAAPGFWGGGFWGPWALGLAAGTYFVQADSPGSDLLGAYGLTQTPCGQPNLVQIFGPDGSEICAFPNSLVGPGDYQVDPTTLTLISY